MPAAGRFSAAANDAAGRVIDAAGRFIDGASPAPAPVDASATVFLPLMRVLFFRMAKARSSNSSAVAGASVVITIEADVALDAAIGEGRVIALSMAGKIRGIGVKGRGPAGFGAGASV